MTDGLRGGLSKTDDARAIETRRRLCEAYVQTIEAGAPDVSVVALCKLAGVGRSTFYAHFATIEDLAVCMIGDVFREMAPIDVERRTAHTLSRKEITRLGVQQLIGSLWTIRVILVGAIRRPVGAALRQHLVAEVVETTRGTVVAQQPHLSESDVNLAAHYIAGGVVELILTWLEAPEVTRDRLVENILILLPAWMI